MNKKMEDDELFGDYDSNVWTSLPVSDERLQELYFSLFQKQSNSDFYVFEEPTPSFTFRVARPIQELNDLGVESLTPYNLALLEALRNFTSSDECILAFDWLHDRFGFYPHRFQQPELVSTWAIPTIPWGESYTFMTTDLRLGLYGHPWYETVCVFGEGFAEEYKRLAPFDEKELIRIDGKDQKR